LYLSVHYEDGSRRRPRQPVAFDRIQERTMTTHPTDQVDRAPTRRNPVAVRENILEIATTEFAAHGLGAASVNEIAAKTNTTKRMIYYYFGSKEGLYTAVLERSYQQMAERLRDTLDVGWGEPLQALRRLAETTFDHHDQHHEHIRLVVGENMAGGEYLRRSPHAQQNWSPILELIAEILRRGREDGTIRADADPIDVQLLVNSLSFFRIANQHTFGILYGRQLASDAEREHLRTMIGDAVVRMFAADKPGPAGTPST
jgi:AcrR family transcriptional regulator